MAPSYTGTYTSSTVGNDTVLVLKTSGTLTLDRAYTGRLLVIGGGGGGGTTGGGGAGGFVENNSWSANAGSYAITIGSGGRAGVAENYYGSWGRANGENGGNSSAFGQTAYGGGGGQGKGCCGAPASNGAAGNGGSGGGSMESGDSPGNPTTGQGNKGGVGRNGAGAGGGGAGGAGNSANDSGPGSGGAGKYSNITGTNTAYAGGGGGGSGGYGTNTASGGVGGGGRSNADNRESQGSASRGTANTGGGGGGGKRDGGFGGSGGSGVVIVRLAGGYNITASASSGGSISPSGTTTVLPGNSQKYTMTAASGYYISSITVDGTAQSITNRSSQSYTFSNVQAAHTIAVNFAANPKITTSAGANGSISPSNPSVSYGGSQTLTIAANSGYQIQSITADSQGVTITNRHSQTYSFTNVTAGHTLAATFEDDWHLTVYGYNAKALYSDGIDPRFTLSLDCNAKNISNIDVDTLRVDAAQGYRIEQYVLFTTQAEAQKFWNGQSYSGVPLWFINDVREELDLVTILKQKNYWLGIITDTYPNKPSILLRPHRDRYLGDVTYPDVEPTALMGT